MLPPPNPPRGLKQWMWQDKVFTVDFTTAEVSVCRDGASVTKLAPGPEVVKVLD